MAHSIRKSLHDKYSRVPTRGHKRVRLSLLMLLSLPPDSSCFAYGFNGIDSEEGRPVESKEEFEGSVEFALKFREGVTGGHASLVGYRRNDEREATYVFLTAAHLLTDADGASFVEAMFASRSLRQATEVSYVIHPDALLNTGQGETYKNDLALIAVRHSTPAIDPEPLPLITEETPEQETGVFQQIRSGDPGPLRKPITEPPVFSGLHRWHVERSATPSFPHSYLLRPVDPDRDRIKLGDSGTVILQKVDDKYMVIGCVALRTRIVNLYGVQNADRGERVVACGGKPAMRWARRQIDAVLSEEDVVKRDWKSLAVGQVAAFPRNALKMTSKQRRRCYGSRSVDRK